jgi:hypothetical protein
VPQEKQIPLPSTLLRLVELENNPTNVEMYLQAYLGIDPECFKRMLHTRLTVSVAATQLVYITSW